MFNSKQERFFFSSFADSVFSKTVLHETIHLSNFNKYKIEIWGKQIDHQNTTLSNNDSLSYTFRPLVVTIRLTSKAYCGRIHMILLKRDLTTYKLYYYPVFVQSVQD